MLFSVDPDVERPTMTVLFPDASPAREHRLATVHIRTKVSSLEELMRVARQELAGFTDTQLLLIRETARPLDRAEAARLDEKGLLLDAREALTPRSVQSVPEQRGFQGTLFCPVCRHRLGEAGGLASNTLRACPGCGASLAVSSPSPDVVVLRVRPKR